MFAMVLKQIGERLGMPWLGHTCGVCRYCHMKRDNLCHRPFFASYTRSDGFATSTMADARFAFPLGDWGDAAVFARKAQA
jgi:propanol-preferring alcohol dehydrogenase